MVKAKRLRVNAELSRTRLAPCSTFKVPNTVFGLEAKYITGKDFTLKYDSKKMPLSSNMPKSWAKDHDLESAIKNSVVWYYKDVARHIGEKRMNEYLEKAHYGNGDITGGIDKFWLSSSLEITPEEQVKFWDDLFSYRLPFKKKNVDLVKSIIVEEQTADYTLRAKTGTCMMPGKKYGAWWVGSVEKSGKTYYFATYMVGDDFGKIQDDRKQITKAYLKDYGVL
jgi:beta-lactamase class D